MKISDVFFNAVAVTLKVKMHAETWINGATASNKNLPSWCQNEYGILNATLITIDGKTFKTTKDHSKWAVADDCGKVPWICIGDINRQVKTKQMNDLFFFSRSQTPQKLIEKMNV